MAQRKLALITGASSGLGVEFAHLFARDGHDVALMARSEDKLRALADELTKKHGIDAHVFPADLSDPSASDKLFAATQARGLEVEYLVNNAGVGSTGPFLDQPLEREAAQIELNVTTLVKLCHLYGRPMVQRGSGRILNVASTAAFQAGPYMATYYASKAFVLSFSEALAHELRPHGVTVTAHCPGATATGFPDASGNGKTRLFQRPGIARADDVAKHAYDAMMQGRVVRVHGALNKVGAFFAQVMPRRAASGVAAKLNAPADSAR